MSVEEQQELLKGYNSPSEVVKSEETLQEETQRLNREAAKLTGVNLANIRKEQGEEAAAAAIAKRESLIERADKLLEGKDEKFKQEKEKRNLEYQTQKEKSERDRKIGYVLKNLDDAQAKVVFQNIASTGGEIADDELQQLVDLVDKKTIEKYGQEEYDLVQKIGGNVLAEDLFYGGNISTSPSVVDELVVEGDETATVANLNNEFDGTPFTFSKSILGSDAIEVSVLDISGVPINSKIVRLDDGAKASQQLRDFMAKSNLSKGNKEFLEGKINGKDISNLPTDKKQLINYKYMLENKDKFSAGKGAGFSMDANAIMRFVNENPDFFPPEELQSIKLQLDEALANQYKEDEQLEGSFFGSLGESFLKGTTQTSKFTTNLGIDIGGALMPSIFMPSNSFSAINFDENGNRLSDSEVIDRVKKKGKREMIAAMDNAVESSFTGTTQAWMNSDERNDVAKALNFVFESLGVVASVGGGNPAPLIGRGGTKILGKELIKRIPKYLNPTLQSLAFFAYAANGIEDEMAGTEYDELSEWKKKLISFPYGVMIGQLEKLGWEASTGAFGNKVFDKISRNIISRAIKSVPKNASPEVIKTAIENSTKAAVADGAIKIVSGGLSEGLVEGTQEFGDVGLKNFVNGIMKKDYFADAPDLTTAKGWKETTKQALESAYYGSIAGSSSAGGGGIIQGTKKRLRRDADIREYNEQKQAHTDKTLREKLIFNINNAQSQGQMTAEQAEVAKEKVLEDAATFEQIPDEGLSNKNKLESFALITERNNLEKEIAGKNEELVTKQRDRIRDINAQLTIIGTQDATTEQESSDLDEDQQAPDVQEMEEGTPQPEPEQVTAEEVEVKEELKPTEEQREKLEKKAVRELKRDNRQTRRKGFKGDRVKGTRKKYEPTQEEIDARVDELFQEEQQEDQEVLDLEAAIEGEVKEGRALPSETTAIEEVTGAVPEDVAVEEEVTTEEAPVDETVVEGVETGKREVEEYFKALEESREKSRIELSLSVEYDDSPKLSKERRELKKKLREAQRDEKEADKVLEEKESVIRNKFPNLKEAYQKKQEAMKNEDKAFYNPLVSSTKQESARVRRRRANKEYYKAFNESINNILNQEAPVAEEVAEALSTKASSDATQMITPVPTKTETKKETPTKKAPTKTKVDGVVMSDKKRSKKEQALVDRAKRAAKALTKIGKGGVTIELHDDTDSFKKVTGQDGRGAYDKTSNTIHINLSKANNTTVAHEAFHAVLLQKVGNTAKVTKTMFDAVRKAGKGDTRVMEYTTTKEVDGKTKTVTETATVEEYLEDFANNYEENVQDEEKLAELTGLLASSYVNLAPAPKSKVRQWVDKVMTPIAERLGIKVDQFTKTDQGVVDLLNAISAKVTIGEEIQEGDVKVLEEIETKPETKKGKAKKISWTKKQSKPQGESTQKTKEVQAKIRDLVKRYEGGEITIEEYNKQADDIIPVKMKEVFVDPVTQEELMVGLKSKNTQTNSPIKEGADVSLRIDIPFMKRTGKASVTIHERKSPKDITGRVLSYRGSAVIKDVEFLVNPKQSLAFATDDKVHKSSNLGRMGGKLVDIGKTIEEQNEAAKKLSQQAIDEGWTQVGINPAKHSYFYDRSTGKPLKSADRVVQVGDLIYAENAKTTTIYDDRFIVKGKTDKKGGPLRFQKEGVSVSENEIIFDKVPPKKVLSSILRSLQGKRRSDNIRFDDNVVNIFSDYVKGNEVNINAENYPIEIQDALEGDDMTYGEIANMLRVAGLYDTNAAALKGISEIGKVAGVDIMRQVQEAQTDPEEQGEGGEVGTIRLQKANIQFKPAPGIGTDTRSFAKFYEEKSLRDFNGKKFVTNMYDFTNAGEVDLGNGYVINLWGGKSYVPYMLEKRGKSLGEVSNLAAFNTKEQAETFIRNSKEENASLFIPHSGTTKGSWQFQQSIFQELTNLALDKKILSKKQLISLFNESIKSAKGKKAFKTFVENYNKKREKEGKKPKNIKDFNSFITNPKEIIELLDIENNMSPDLRKIFNSKYSTNEEFKKALGVKNSIDFALKMEDPLNNGISGGDLMGIIEFDNTSFKIRKPNKNDPDYHPSFAYTVEAKIKGVYQPTEFYKSNEVTDSYTKNNKDGAKVSRKTDFTLEEYELAKKGIAINDEGKKVKRKPFKGTLEEFQEMKFEKSNVSSSAGSIPKVAELSETAMREQKSLMQIGRYYNANNQGFFPSQVNSYQLKQDLEQIGFGLKRAKNGAYYATRNGRKVNPFPPEPSRYRFQRDDIGIVEAQVFDDKVAATDIIIAARREGFNNKAIRFYLLNRRKGEFKAKEVDALLKVDATLFDQLPDSFAEIEGGATAGLRLYEKIDKFRQKLMDKNNRIKKPFLEEKQIEELVKEKRKELKQKGLSKEEVVKKTLEFEKRERSINQKRTKKLSMNEIMDKTIEFLEQQPEYKKSGDSFVEKGVTKYRKGISTQQAKMQAELQETIGQKPTKEVADGIKKLKQNVRAWEKGQRDLQSIKNELKSLMRKHLPKEMYTKSETLTLIKAISDADKGNLSVQIKKVQDLITTKTNQRLTSEAIELLNLVTQKVQSGRLKGVKVSNEVRKRLDAIRDNVLDPKKLNTKDGEFLMRKNEQLTKEFNEINVQVVQTQEDLQKLNDLQIAIALNQAQLSEMKDSYRIAPMESAVDSLDRLISGGRGAFQIELEEAHAQYQKQFADLWEQMTGQKLDMSDPDIQEVINKKLKEQQDRTERERMLGKFNRVLAKMYRSVGQGINNHEALFGLMDKINVMPGDLAGGKIQELVTNRVDEASIKYKGRMMSQEGIIDDKAREIFGKRWKRQMRKFQSITDDTFKIDLRDSERTLSQGEMAYLYNQFKDPALHPTFENMLGENYSNIMKDLESKLNPQLKEWADWQVNEYFPSVYNHYNDTYKKIYRTDMPFNEHYAGRIFREGVDSNKPLDLLGEASIYQTSIAPGSTKVRNKDANNDILPMDINRALLSYVQDMEYFAAYAEPMRDINKMFNNKNTSKFITKTYGKNVQELIQDQIQKVSAKGPDNSRRARVINALNNSFVFAKIALSPVVFVKQLTSIFTYGNDIGYANWIKYSAKAALKTPQGMGKTWKEITDNSVYIQDRAKGANIKRAIGNYYDTKGQLFNNEFLESAQRALMVTTRTGDKLAIMLGGMPNYLYYKDQYKKQNPNATEQEVIDYAVKKFEKDTKQTQQSSDLQDRDYYQTSDGFMRAMNMFMTTPKQYLRKEIIALRNLRRMMRGEAARGTAFQNIRQFATYHFVMPMLFQWATLGFPLGDDWEEEDTYDMFRAALLGNLNGVFILGDILNTFADFAQGKPWASQVNSIPLFTQVAAVVKAAEKITKLVNAKEPDAKKIAEARYEFYTMLSEVVGVPGNTIYKMIKNIQKLPFEEDEKKMILRLLNYSDYVIDGPKKKKKKSGGIKPVEPLDPSKIKPVQPLGGGNEKEGLSPIRALIKGLKDY